MCATPSTTRVFIAARSRATREAGQHVSFGMRIPGHQAAYGSDSHDIYQRYVQ